MSGEPNRLVITHRDGLARVIAVRQDETDETKWHLAEPVVLEPHDVAVFLIDGNVVDTFRHGMTEAPLNTLFYTPPR